MYTKMPLCAIVALAPLLVAACGESPSALAGGTATTRDLLGGTLELPLDGDGSSLTLSARPVVGGSVTHRVALDVPDGSVAVRADASGALVLERLTVALDDIVIDPEDLPPAGLHLADLRVTLAQAEPAEASWSADGQAAIAAISADLMIEWGLVSAGRVVPLAPQRIQGVDLQLEVGPAADGGVSVTLRGGHGGAFLRPAGVFELSDLSLELVARSAATELP